MRIAVTGASGLIGSALVRVLRGERHDVLRLVRRPAGAADELTWQPSAASGRALDPAALAGVDAVVHLGGVGIGDARWTTDRQRAILDSRVEGTTAISTALAAAAAGGPAAPRVLLSASAVGFYGDTGDQVVTERDPAGAGFLADVCRAWEAATGPAAEAGVRVVHLRTGLVLSPRGGLLGRMLPLARLGLLGPLGSGRQYQPWISLTDEVGAIRFLLTADEVRGPVNLTGPEPVTNAELTRTLLHVLGRPALAPKVPGFALRAMLGGFADEGVLIGQRAVPEVLRQAGYRFTHRTAAAALRWAAGH
jgi:uncharacterized protein (TIGR01777 family)